MAGFGGAPERSAAPADRTTGVATAGPAVGPAAAVVDSRGTVIGWTPSAERTFGYTAADVVGRSAALLLAGRDPDGQLARWVERPAAARSPWSAAVLVRLRDGTTTRMTVEAVPLAGEPRDHWFVTAIDPSGLAAWPPRHAPVAATLLSRAPLGLSVWDPELRCIWVNPRAAAQDVRLRRPRLGQHITDIARGREGRAVAAAMRAVLETGEPVIEREYTWRVPGEDEDRVLSATYFRVDGPDGRPIGVCNMATDIDKSLARQHLLALSEVGNRIGTSLDVTRTAQELADAAVPLLADFVTVDLGEAVLLGEEPPLGRPRSPAARSPVIRRVGLASVQEGVPEAAWQVGDEIYVPPSSPFSRALESGRSHFEPVMDTSPGTWVDQDPRRADLLAEHGMHSMIIVPLKARGMILGQSVLTRGRDRVPFSRDDLLLIEEFAGRAALSLDNARRYTRERAAAVALQRNLLPRDLSGGAGAELAFRYLPADVHEGVGGDWFDAVLLPAGRVGLVVGDVVGHGIDAAALMGQLRTVMATLADLDLPPETVLARLDRRVVLMAGQDGLGEGEETGPDPDGNGGGTAVGAGPVMSCTCVYAVYDPVSRRCTIASAGHPPPIVLRPDGRAEVMEVPPGPPIGLGTMAYESASFELPEGSVIALYTDGLVETRTADLDVGLGRLKDALSAGAPTLEELASRVVTAMGPHVWRRTAEGPGGATSARSAEDDIALLLARTRVLTAEQAEAQRRR
ncbi:SpoIIE family protein phosphatase [Actinacidiphila yeochonensis]|uniref:SpoIIE family protein phosphatase n=1 Tax=Actinacidiphila yeochonensis TaxID=89050 RepID=UPI0006895B46|nr:SpoIIE family protein phosphatase [Actinacidiphila yeochonensis]